MKKLGALSIAAVAALAFGAGCTKEAAEKEDEAKPGAEASEQAAALPDSLLALARITLDSARAIALAQVPSGVFDKVELEREDGKLIFSFDIKVAGQPGVEEVHVDALTGAVLSKEHEDAAAEGREAADDSAASHRPAVPAPAKRP